MRGLGVLLALVVAGGLIQTGRSQEPDAGRHIVFMIGEREYKTESTLRDYFEKELEPRAFTASFVIAANEGAAKNEFDGLVNAMQRADLLFLSVRRRAPRVDELRAVRAHLEAGKPLLGIRTASHAFDARSPSPAGHAQWIGFDEEVLGAKYSGHYGDEPFTVQVAPGVADHELLRGVTIRQSTKLYKGELRSPQCTLLLVGRLATGRTEPVAWTHQYGDRRSPIFYTSLGVESDFQSAGFRRFLLNAIHSLTNLPVASDDAAQVPSAVDSCP